MLQLLRKVLMERECSVLQQVAVCCSALQCGAVVAEGVGIEGMRRGAGVCSVLQYVAVCCSVLQCVVGCCRVLQRVVKSVGGKGMRRGAGVLQCVVACCSVL